MSKEELLKYLIAEIDLIMHDKDYRFKNEDGTWYSRESCRDLTNEELFEELRTELRQLGDLEAKLAESEKQNKRLYNEKESAEKILKMSSNEQTREIMELKQQLAEKTLTIEQINKAFIENRSLWKGKYERANQDKISFAVEQLEKVKNYIITDEKDMFGATYLMKSGYVLEYIDNQIEQLKEVK